MKLFDILESSDFDDISLNSLEDQFNFITQKIESLEHKNAMYTIKVSDLLATIYGKFFIPLKTDAFQAAVMGTHPKYVAYSNYGRDYAFVRNPQTEKVVARMKHLDQLFDKNEDTIRELKTKLYPIRVKYTQYRIDQQKQGQLPSTILTTNIPNRIPIFGHNNPYYEETDNQYAGPIVHYPYWHDAPIKFKEQYLEFAEHLKKHSIPPLDMMYASGSKTNLKYAILGGNNTFMWYHGKQAPGAGIVGYVTMISNHKTSKFFTYFTGEFLYNREIPTIRKAVDSNK